MREPARVFLLDAIRTDGWFERIGEGIGSFQALCDIIGPRFFAFAMITGARIVALTVDRRNPEQTLVDYVIGSSEDEVSDADAQRLTLGDFRRRLVAALIADEPTGPPPTRETDLEALQLYLGVRYLLLAPLYGYSLSLLRLDTDGATLELHHDGVEQKLRLEAFRARIRGHVREELERASRGQSRGAVDLARVPEAEAAAAEGAHERVLQLLGAWPAPLAIFLRTPDGQLLNPETRAQIATGLALLGASCAALGETAKGEEVLRLGVQYAGDGRAAPSVFLALGRALLEDARPGEAISPLRRAASLGAAGVTVLPLLARAFVERGRYLAALGALEEAERAGAPLAELAALNEKVQQRLGPALDVWRQAKAPH